MKWSRSSTSKRPSFKQNTTNNSNNNNRGERKKCEKKRELNAWNQISVAHRKKSNTHTFIFVH